MGWASRAALLLPWLLLRCRRAALPSRLPAPAHAPLWVQESRANQPSPEVLNEVRLSLGSLARARPFSLLGLLPGHGHSFSWGSCQVGPKACCWPAAAPSHKGTGGLCDGQLRQCAALRCRPCRRGRLCRKRPRFRRRWPGTRGSGACRSGRVSARAAPAFPRPVALPDADLARARQPLLCCLCVHPLCAAGANLGIACQSFVCSRGGWGMARRQHWCIVWGSSTPPPPPHTNTPTHTHVPPHPSPHTQTHAHITPPLPTPHPIPSRSRAERRDLRLVEQLPAGLPARGWGRERGVAAG